MAADAIAGATGAAGLIAGATPFGWAGLAASVLGSATQGAPAGPSQAQSGMGGLFTSVDNSGWTVATSGSKASATSGDRGGLTGAGVLSGMTGSNLSTTALLAVGFVLLVVALKKK